MRRFIALAAVMLLCLGICLPVRAEAEYPLSQGIVTDLGLTGALGEDTVQDLTELSRRMEQAGLGQIHVALTHFLGGAEASSYARALFDAWQLDSRDLLLLVVIGEETYALAVGDTARSALSRDTQTSLLANHFRTPFLNRQYNEAVAQFAAAAAEQMAKAQGVSLSTAGLFGRAAIQSTAKPKTGISSLFTQPEKEEDWPKLVDTSNYSVNWRAWIVWGLVIYFIFFRKKKKSRRGRR